MAVKYTRPRGTQDVLPGQSGRWLRLEKLMRRTVGLYGYKEIRLPTFETAASPCGRKAPPAWPVPFWKTACWVPARPR